MWNNFNNAESQTSYDLIPNNTLAKVRMSIKPGGYDDEKQGWDRGYATRNADTGSIYLSCEFIILEGKFAKRKIWGLIGLHSEKGPNWANIGRSFIRGILNSSRGFKDQDNSEAAQNARRINSLADLDGLEFIAKVSLTTDQNGEAKNEIKFAMTPDHSDYAKLIGNLAQAPIQNQDMDKVVNRPTWAG